MTRVSQREVYSQVYHSVAYLVEQFDRCFVVLRAIGQQRELIECARHVFHALSWHRAITAPRTLHIGQQSPVLELPVLERALNHVLVALQGARHEHEPGGQTEDLFNVRVVVQHAQQCRVALEHVLEIVQ